jgi:AraC-like DNA-binding protein
VRQPFRPDLRSTAAFWVKAVVESLEPEGLDVVALCSEAGLNLAALSDPDARFPTDSVSRLWEVATARSANPCIGLASWRTAKPAAFDVVAYTMMSAPNLLGLLHRLVRYIRIVSDAASVSVSEDRDGYRLILEIAGDKLAVPWQRVAFDLLTLLSFCRWVAARDLVPLVLELASVSSDDLRRFPNSFQCPLRVNTPANALLFSRTDAMLSLPTANRLLADTHEQIADAHLRQLDSGQTRHRVRAIIARRLPHGELSRAEIAEALAMSERTLHRRLTDEGTSFQILLDETRRGLAESYIGRADLSLADVAYLLGFRDQSGFYRAYKRWFGAPPRQHRVVSRQVLQER